MMGKIIANILGIPVAKGTLLNQIRTFYVATDGDDSNSGLSESEPLANHPFMSSYTGDIVLIPSDIVLMNKGDTWSISDPTEAYLTISVDGEEGKDIITSSYGTGSLPIIQIATASNFPVIYANAKSFFKFDGIAIKHHDKTYNSNENRCGILLDGTTNPCHDIEITNCQINNIPFAAIRGLKNCYNLKIGKFDTIVTATTSLYSNHIYDFGYAGIAIEGTNPATLRSNVDICYNYIHDSSRTVAGQNAYGVYLSAIVGSAGWPKNVNVNYNNVQNMNTWQSLDMHGGSYINFNNNYIKQFGARAVTLANITVGALDKICDHINVENNIIEQPQSGWVTGGEETFIKAGGSTNPITNIVIRNNECFYTTKPTVGAFGGIDLYLANGGIVTGNKIFKSGTGGKAAISLQELSGTTLVNKNFVNGWAYGVYVGPNVGTLNFVNNIITKIDDRTVIYFGSGVGATSNVNIYNNVLLASVGLNGINVLSGITAGGVLRIKNNIIGKTALGTCIQVFINTAQNGTFECNYNLYWNSNGAYYGWIASYQSFAQWKALGFDANTPNTVASLDPLFENLGGSLDLATDYKVTALSPARLVGTDVGITDDFFNNPVASPPNIGAYQL